MGPPKQRASVLVVEDEWMVAELIALAMADAGYRVVGPVGHLDEAVAIASSEQIAAALLDIELGPGVYAYPIARTLEARQIPFAFVSSMPIAQVEPAYRNRPRVQKPFEPETLRLVISTLLRDQDRLPGSSV